MKLVSKRLWMPSAILLIVALFIAPGELIAQSRASCGCQDVPDLINRLTMANVAFDKARELLSAYRPPSEWASTSAELRVIVDSGIRDSMSLVENKQARTARAETDYSTCKTNIKADTPCLESLLWLREQINRDRCVGLKGMQKPLTLRAYLENVQIAYKQEMIEIRSRLLGMPPSCRPEGWIGTITVSETKKLVITNTIPGTSRFDHGAVETFDDETTRTGVIRLDGKSDFSPSTWQVTGTLIKSWVHNSTVDCDSTPLKEELVPAKSETRTEINRSGSRSTTVAVGADVSLDGGIFLQVAFQIPEVDLSGNSATTNTVTGGCPGMAQNDRESISHGPSALSPEDAKFKSGIGEPFEWGGGKLHRASGSEVYYPGPIMRRDPPGMTTKHAIRITFNLFALKDRLPL